MNSSDKYALLGALSFFFVCMAMALIWLKDQAAQTNSYMPRIDANQSKPLQNSAKRQARLPESVLHYSSNDMVKDSTVQCMLEPEFKNMVNAHIVEDNYKLSIMGELHGDQMQIFTHEDGRFFVAVIGPDAVGTTEACIVAEGTGWLKMN